MDNRVKTLLTVHGQSCVHLWSARLNFQTRDSMLWESVKAGRERQASWFDWHRLQMGGSIPLQTTEVPPRAVCLAAD